MGSKKYMQRFLCFALWEMKISGNRIGARQNEFVVANFTGMAALYFLKLWNGNTLYGAFQLFIKRR